MGIKVTVASGYGLDMRELDFSSIWYADQTVETSKVFRAYYNSGFIDEFRGSGFTYDRDGVPNGGTATSYAGFYNDTRVFTIDNASISVKDMVKASLSYGTGDDLKLLMAELSGADTFSGGGARDVFYSGGGKDSLKGNGGNDLLYAGAGDDKIEGGLGKDSLYGEAGSDIFIFRSAKDSTLGSAGRDTIFDFTSADRIDLHGIDANTKSSGNQDFSFIGTKEFSGHAGQLRYEKHSSDTYIYGDTNGDGKADFAIHLDDAVTLKSGYFLL
jgi:Ca2+-binding RTX toxin-like protein